MSELIPCRKISEILSLVGTLQVPCQIVPVVESVFNKIAGMNSRPAFSLKKSFHKGKLWKRCYTINVMKNVLLRQLVFQTFSEKNL